MDFWLKKYMHRHFLKGTLFSECHHGDLHKVVVRDDICRELDGGLGL